MKITALEKKLLEKLEKGLLDGSLPYDIEWRRDGVVCRKMIVRGIPYFICFKPKPDYGNEVFVVAQHYETDEMKLWFLKQNGWQMQDPDVVEYSRRDKTA